MLILARRVIKLKLSYAYFSLVGWEQSLSDAHSGQLTNIDYILVMPILSRLDKHYN